jgi:outer membrane receptor for ferric coprogen and ferric-rhodotorulic acid
MQLTLTLKIEKNVETVTVTASDGYATTVQTTGSRVPIRVLDLPQSTYTVTHQLLEDRGVDSVKDALAGVPGVQPTSWRSQSDAVTVTVSTFFSTFSVSVSCMGARACTSTGCSTC